MLDNPYLVTPMASSLSVIIITKNEVGNLAECLASLGNIHSEIIVVDSASNDGTVEIARSAGATVIQTSIWPGFGPQKSIALNAATCDWVLSLDADERLTDTLRNQIRLVLANNLFDSYEMPRLSYFLGKPIRHGGWYPDHIVRLCRRGRAHFSDDLVHERLIPEGEIGRLDAPLQHYSYRNREDVERKIKSYSDAGAKQLFASGKQSNYLKATLHGTWAFMRTYVFRRGFLDGAEGFQIAVMNKRSTYLKYAKLITLRQH